jgi:hypothetical protein
MLTPSCNKINFTYHSLSVWVILVLLSCMLVVITVPVHEATHVLLLSFDRYIEVKEVHLIGIPSFSSDSKCLSSLIGYVIVKERYPGAFNMRPGWIYISEEIVSILVQILIILTVLTLLTPGLVRRVKQRLKN